MKIRKSILDKINNAQSRMRIALSLGCTEQAVQLQIRMNKDNGRLTNMDALQAIAQEVDCNDILSLMEGGKKHSGLSKVGVAR